MERELGFIRGVKGGGNRWEGDPDGTYKEGYMEEETVMGEAWGWGGGMD